MAKKKASAELFNDSEQQLTALMNKIKNIVNTEQVSEDIPLWTKKNTDDYWTRIGDLEKESSSIKGRFIGLVVAIALAVVGLIVAIIIDYSKLNKYIDAKEHLEEQLRSYQAEFSKLQYQTNNIENYINVRVENEVNKAFLELYKNNQKNPAH